MTEDYPILSRLIDEHSARAFDANYHAPLVVSDDEWMKARDEMKAWLASRGEEPIPFVDPQFGKPHFLVRNCPVISQSAASESKTA